MHSWSLYGSAYLAAAKAVKGKITILADGGVRTGVDVVKMIGLGADAVLIGRPFVTASFGGKTDGVKTYVENIKNELIYKKLNLLNTSYLLTI